MQKTSSFLVAFLVILFSACAANKPVAGSGKNGGGGNETKAKTKTAEDLSAYRPKFEVTETSAMPVVASIEPVAHVNEAVKMLMDTVAASNKNIKYAQGFRILAYTGNDRTTAMNIRRAIINRFPEERDYLTYKQPTYRLRIGDYLSRVEANQVLQELADVLPHALIVTEQVNLVRPAAE